MKTNRSNYDLEKRYLKLFIEVIKNRDDAEEAINLVNEAFRDIIFEGEFMTVRRTQSIFAMFKRHIASIFDKK